MATFDTLQAAYDAALPAGYDEDGDDPDAPCHLCDQAFDDPADPRVETNWGPMHESCALSHDTACGDLAEAK